MITVLLLVGTTFMVLGAWGLLRLPDVWCRLHAQTKSVTLGLTGLLLAVALQFRDPETLMKCLLVVLFQYLTSPIAAHMISRAAYRLRLPYYSGTVRDELRG